MSTPPPNDPWGQPTPPNPPAQPQPQTPPPGAWAQPTPTAPQPEVAVAPPSGGGGNGKKIGIVVGALAVVAALVIGGFALLGGGDDGARSTTSDDPDEAVAVAEDAVRAVLRGDCDRAEEFATRTFRAQLDDLCGERYPDSRVTDSSLLSDDPVVVLVEFEVQDAELSYPLSMEYDDGDEMWFVDSIDGVAGLPDPTDPGPTDPDPGPTDPTGGGDADDAIAAATSLVQALIDLDCDRAARYATPAFADDELDGACDDDPGRIDITDATVISDDPVAVRIEYEGDQEGSFQFEMVLDDGDWLVSDFYFGGSSSGTTDGPGAAPTDDPANAVANARAAVEALAAGDCDEALSYATEFFTDVYGEAICTALPAGTDVTGAELSSESPVIVSVDTDAGFSIELRMVFEDGTWLVDGYSV